MASGSTCRAFPGALAASLPLQPAAKSSWEAGIAAKPLRSQHDIAGSASPEPSRARLETESPRELGEGPTQLMPAVRHPELRFQARLT